MTDEHQQTGTGWPEPTGPRVEPPADPRAEPAASVEPASAETPAAETPAAETPAAETPAAETPAAETPTAEPTGVEAASAEPDDAETDDLDLVEPEPDPVPAPGPQAVPAPRRPRFTAAGAVVALLVGLLGFALVVQLRSNAGDQQLSSARPQDLVGILSDLDARKDRLQQEITTLQGTQQQLAAGTQGREAALSAAAKRAADLGILAGTLPAQGPGVSAMFTAGRQGLKAAVILDAVEELRDAGAEAMQIEGGNGTVARIVASTSFLDGTGGLQVDGQLLTGPYTIVAIGDPPTMQTALNIPGGVADTVRNVGGNVIVNQTGTVRVTALHQVGTPKYARPVS